MDSAKAWRTASELMLPSASIHQENREEAPELVINPLKMAELFNKFFRKNITDLIQKTATEVTIATTTRLRNWLSKRLEPPSKFKIKK